MFVYLKIITKPGTLGDWPKPMKIQLDSDFSVGCWCHWVTDADFAAGDRQYISGITPMPMMVAIISW